MKHDQKQTGFTLIELLVVISIIGFLASIVLTSVAKARYQARDARKIQDMKTILTALNQHYQDTGSYPGNYNCAGSYCSGGSGTWGTCSTDTTGAYTATFQPLVTSGVLTKIPYAATGAYCYYNYGPGTPYQVVLATVLEATTPSTTGVAPSLRWNWGGTNWCDSTVLNNWYCLQARY